MEKDSFYIKVRGAFILWFIVIVHVILVFNLCTMVATITKKNYSLEDINKVIDSRLEETSQFGEITRIYSGCNHEWEILEKSSNGALITVTCDKCGTIQVIKITKEALYINVDN